MLKLEVGVNVGRVGVAPRLVVGEIDLHGAHRRWRAEVHRQGLAGPLVRRDPEGARVLVRGAAGGELAERRRCGDRLAVRQQHPAGKQALDVVDLPRRHEVREIGEPRRRPHLPVRLELGRKHVDAPLERPIVADPRGAGVPPIAVRVLEARAVARPFDEAAGLVGDRIVGRVSERAERLVGHIGTVGVDVELGARRSVL